MKENEWCNFDWDQAMFPDIDHQLEVMKKEKNLKICGGSTPHIGQKSPLFKEAKELRLPSGRSRTATSGRGTCGRPAWVLWTSRTRTPAHGISRSSEGCPIRASIASRPISGERTGRRRLPRRQRPAPHAQLLHLPHNKCVFDLLEEYKGKNEARLFARSATVGGQVPRVHWGGDCLFELRLHV